MFHTTVLSYSFTIRLEVSTPTLVKVHCRTVFYKGTERTDLESVLGGRPRVPLRIFDRSCLKRVKGEGQCSVISQHTIFDSHPLSTQKIPPIFRLYFLPP